LRSSANDLLTFVSAELGYTKSTLAPAMAAMLDVCRPAGPGLDVALAWHVLTNKSDGKELIWHNGGTGGFRSFVGFDKKARVGVVVLSNASTMAGVDDIALHLLDARIPLATMPKQHVEIKVDPKLFDSYVGQYQMAPNVVLTMTREDTHFFTQLTGQPKFEVFAEGERDYFLKVIDAQLTFEVDASGRATAIVLHQNGRDLRGPRIP